MTIHPKLIAFCIILYSGTALAQFNDLTQGSALSVDDLLRVEQAFQPQALRSGDSIELVWSIRPGYYMYRKQFRVYTGDTEITEIDIPGGDISYDPFFDEELEIYRDEVPLGFATEGDAPITVRFQGCADAGYCYPPSWVAFAPSADSDSVSYLGIVDGPSSAADTVETESSSIYLYSVAAIILLSGLIWLFIYRTRSARG